MEITSQLVPWYMFPIKGFTGEIEEVAVSTSSDRLVLTVLPKGSKQTYCMVWDVEDGRLVLTEEQFESVEEDNG